MNKKQIETIIKDALLFTIITNKQTYPELNKNKIEFQEAGLIKITTGHKAYDYIETKDVKIIKIIEE